VTAELTGAHFTGPERARAYLEKRRWPEGAACPHCGLIGEAYPLKPKEGGLTGVRPGVWKCSACRKQFTVTVGTIFEGRHIPLHKWLAGIRLLHGSKNRVSLQELQQTSGVSYKTAWFMARTIRYELAQAPAGLSFGELMVHLILVIPRNRRDRLEMLEEAATRLEARPKLRTPRLSLFNR